MPSYVGAQLEPARLKLAQCEARSTRNEDNMRVPGLVVLATKI